MKVIKHRNPTLWLPSLAFHYGLYLLFALSALLKLQMPVPGIEIPRIAEAGYD